MSKRLLVSTPFLLILSLAGTALGQGAALTARSTEPSVLAGLGDHMEFPALPAGHHFVVTLDDAGKPTVTTAEGKVAFLELTADPPKLMTIFAEQVDRAERMAQGSAIMAMGQAGMEPRDAAKLMRAIFDLPREIASLEVKVTGNPEQLKSDGMDVDVLFVPLPGSGFAEAVAASKPSAKGPPKIDGNGMIRMAASVDAGVWSKTRLGESILSWISAMGGKQAGTDPAKVSALMTKLFACTGDSLSADVGPHGMRMLLALDDAKQYRELMQSPDYLAYAKAASSMGNLDVVQTTTEHRSVTVIKQEVKAKEGATLPPNPVFGEGPMVSHFAAAGDWLVMVMGGGEAGVQQLIDQALDGKVERAPLAPGVLFTMDIQVGKLLEQMGAPIGDHAPEAVHLRLDRADRGLGLRLRVK